MCVECPLARSAMQLSGLPSRSVPSDLVSVGQSTRSLAEGQIDKRGWGWPRVVSTNISQAEGTASATHLADLSAATNTELDRE